MKIKIILLSMVLGTMFSCSKSTEQKNFVGTWDYQYFTHYDDNRTITWVFSDDNTLTQYFVQGNYADTIVATYSVDANFGDAYYITVSGIDVYNDGKYQVLKLNKKFLIIQRVESDGKTAGVFVRKEFVKK